MKIYIKYIVNKFLKLLFLVVLFFSFSFVTKFIRRIKFFEDSDEGLYYPLLLNIINAPSILVNVYLFFNINSILIN